ncbi:hypothetical protein B0T14DRAFT_559340 [Immersiella caudata]|uniref:DUF7924 domain-containing protein n=1 Tax=Immersiella caudata TaxID=314043 RepID=A0AA40CAY3_9PEZI|nr:hypothetical protein B0T14DRAFT_559340 [Immersiella caudata]
MSKNHTDALSTETMPLRRSLRLRQKNAPRHAELNVDSNHPDPEIPSKHKIEDVNYDHPDPELPSKHNIDDVNYDHPDPELPSKHNLDDPDLSMNDVRRGDYRANCLRPNGICFRLPSDTLPHQVALLTNDILAGAPRPLVETGAMMRELDALGTYGCSEAAVQQCLFKGLFPMTLPPQLSTSYQRIIARHLIPAHPDAPCFLPLPRPDVLYGYNNLNAFTEAQQTTLNRVQPESWSYAQATLEASFPFFIVELKAAAGTGGNLWDAINQCAGGAAGCLQALGQLNTALDAAGCRGLLINVCYGLVIDNNLGQLYASWKDGSSVFYMQRVASFLLSDAQHFSHLCACVAAILRWGGIVRLRDIRVAADYIRGQR